MSETDTAASLVSNGGLDRFFQRATAALHDIERERGIYVEALRDHDHDRAQACLRTIYYAIDRISEQADVALGRRWRGSALSAIAPDVRIEERA